jgi:anaerobic C4-dicarboxylate transporter
MTALTITPANISASEERGAVKARFVAAVDLTVGMAVYLDTNNKVNKCTALTALGAQCIGIIVTPDNFSAESTIRAGGTATVCVFGKVWGWQVSNTLISGKPVYVDKTTAGSLNDAAPTGAYQFQVGHELGNDTIFVDPGTSSPVSA